LDALTIELARRGDREATARLLGSLADPLFRFCLSQLRHNEDRARDATQETALRVLRDLPGFRGDSRVETWAIGIALNVTREMRRKIDRVDTIKPDAMRMRLQPIAPDDASEQAEQQDVLRSVLNDLPDRQREAVVLRFFEDLSVEETAGVMKCATGTVKATVHQALRALRNRLTIRERTDPRP